MKISAIGKTVLFEFLDETRNSDGAFTERYAGKILVGVVKSNDCQTTTNRWGVVKYCGPDAKEEKICEGDYILIESGKWTVRINVDGEIFWKTDSDCVIATSTDVRDTYSF